MRRMLSYSRALALIPLLLAPARPSAAANVILRGAVTQAFFFTLTYTPDGKVSHNQTRDDQYTKDYKNSQLYVADNSQGLLGTLDTSNNLNLVAPPLIALSGNANNTVFLLDGTTKDTKMFVSFHAYLYTHSDDPKKLTALGHQVELGTDGTVNSTDVTLDLQVQ